VFLIADGHPVHKSRSVSRWLAEHAAKIRIFWLPRLNYVWPKDSGWNRIRHAEVTPRFILKSIGHRVSTLLLGFKSQTLRRKSSWRRTPRI
jgi:hypothetical protein